MITKKAILVLISLFLCSETWAGGSSLSKPSSGSGGISSYARGFTKVVAAYNSIDKTDADYVCNGTNDEQEIQDAIDRATGGTVLLLEGNYVIQGKARGSVNGAFFLRTAGTNIYGQGWGTLLDSKSQTSATPTLYCATDNTVIRNLHFIANDNAGSTATTHITIASNPSGWMVADNWFEDCNNIALTSTGKGQIINNYFLDGKSNALYHSAAAVIIRGNRFESISGKCISILGANYTLIADNHLYNNDASADNGIEISGTNYCTIVGNNICIEKAGKICIYVSAVSDGVTVVGNLLDCSSTSAGGIDVANSDFCTIAGNTIYGPASYGIYIESNSTNCFVGNNVIRGSGGYCNQAVISNNTCSFIFGEDGAGTAAQTPSTSVGSGIMIRDKAVWRGSPSTGWSKL